MDLIECINNKTIVLLSYGRPKKANLQDTTAGLGVVIYGDGLNNLDSYEDSLASLLNH